MKKVMLFTLAVLSALSSLFAQTAAKSPFSKLGYKKQVMYTSSKGEFEEFHGNPDVVEIGSVYFNTKTNKVVGFICEEKEKGDIASATSAMSVDPKCEKYYWISPYAYCLNNPVRFTDPDGREVRIKGDAEYRKETFNNMQQLSSAKLVLLKNGKVVEASSYKGKSSQISLTGTVTGNGKDKVNGTTLVHDVISDKHTATIQAGKVNEFEPTSQTNASTAKVGSGGTLSFNNEPTGVVRNIYNQNGTDYVSDQSVLGHELLHARHSFQGTVNYKTVDVQDPDRNNWTFPMSKEELRTRSFENYIRSEQGDEPRAQPTIINQ